METASIKHKHEDLRLPYKTLDDRVYNLQCRIYQPVRDENIKGAVNVTIGISGAIDDGAADKLAIALAKRGFIALLYNPPNHGKDEVKVIDDPAELYKSATSDGEFTLENCLDAADAVNQELQRRLKELETKLYPKSKADTEEGDQRKRLKLYAMTHSHGSRVISKGIHKRGNPYAAVSFIGPMLSYMDIYRSRKVGVIYTDLYEKVKYTPIIRELFCRSGVAIMNIVTEMNRPSAKGTKPRAKKPSEWIDYFNRLGCLRFGEIKSERAYKLAEVTISAKALYDEIEGLEVPIQLHYCMKDGILFPRPIDEVIKNYIERKWRRIAKNPEFNLIGELGKKQGPNHVFEVDGKEPFEGEEFEKMMDKIAEFFLKHSSK